MLCGTTRVAFIFKVCFSEADTLKYGSIIVEVSSIGEEVASRITGAVSVEWYRYRSNYQWIRSGIGIAQTNVSNQVCSVAARRADIITVRYRYRSN